jgi:phosphopantothenoylcysteine decarboxylase/phosphopantothenate--cysteine ligase
MLEACLQYFPASKACIMSAAVADYTPVSIAQQKIKKQDAGLNIDLKKTTDILKTLGQSKRADQLLIGFALETENEEQYAVDKLQRKNLDLIILNSLNDAGAGFKNDTNKITMIDKYLQKTIFTLKSKTEVAQDICQKVIQLISQ